MKSAGIELLLRQNKEGRNYDVTYINYNDKTVFNGSTLGKDYSINGILERVNGPTSYSTEKSLTSAPHPNNTGETFSKIAARNWRIEPTENEVLDAPLVSTKQNCSPEKLIQIFFRQQRDKSSLPFELENNRAIKKRNKINQ